MTENRKSAPLCKIRIIPSQRNICLMKDAQALPECGEGSLVNPAKSQSVAPAAYGAGSGRPFPEQLGFVWWYLWVLPGHMVVARWPPHHPLCLKTALEGCGSSLRTLKESRCLLSLSPEGCVRDTPRQCPDLHPQAAGLLVPDGSQLCLLQWVVLTWQDRSHLPGIHPGDETLCHMTPPPPRP